MSLKTIINQVGAKTGLSPTNSRDRLVLLEYINRAAEQVYNEADFPGSLWESIFSVDSNQQITFPFDVDKVRMMREYNTQLPWNLVDMRPRYFNGNWKNDWRTWRDKGKSPIQRSITSTDYLTFTVKAIETPNIVVTLSGPAEGSAQIGESVTMDALSKQTTIKYSDLVLLSKDRVSLYDVNVIDINANIISSIPSVVLEASYRIIDVALYPWNAPAVDTEHYMEVMYKKSLRTLSNDSDTFMTGLYDQIIFYRSMQAWMTDQQKTDQALAFDVLASRDLGRIIHEEERGQNQVANFGQNPHDTLMWKPWRRVRPGYVYGGSRQVFY